VFPFSKRSSAQATSSQIVSTKQAVWSKFTVAKATKDGYISSGWVFRAINEIKQAASSVPWMVVDKDGAPIEGHHVAQLLNRPNPSIPRQQLFELIVSWLQLSGNAYLRKVTVGGKTTELWPLSPDKTAPVAGTAAGEWVRRFDRKGPSGSTVESYLPNEIIHLLLPNPANPLQGVSPLEAAARAVDTDVAQLNFNKAAMDNRGVLDGIFVFKDLAVAQWDTVREKIRELYTGSANARTPGVLSAEADYIRTGMTPAEMDFLNSRKFNRDEIMLIFGVPPQLIGAQESSTFNNFSASQRIFWEQTILPLLRKMQAGLQHSLQEELRDGEEIVPDTSRIAALQDNVKDRVAASKDLWDMGVPVASLNSRFELGLKDVPNADLPWSGNPPSSAPKPSPSQTASSSVRLDTRSSHAFDMEWRAVDKQREELAQGVGFETMKTLMESQRDAVLKAIDEGADPIAAIQETRQEWLDAVGKLQMDVAKEFL